METSTSPNRVYKFDELFFDIYKAKFIRRKSPDTPLVLCRFKAIIAALIVLIVLTAGLLMKLISIFSSSDFDFTEISAICQIWSAILMAIGRGSSLFLNSANINRMLRILEKLYPVTSEDQRRYHLESYAKKIIFRNNTMQKLIATSSIGYSSIAFLQSLFGAVVLGDPYEFRYPFISWYPFNENRLFFYPFIYAFHALGGMCTAVFYFYEEFLFTTCVLQTNMHYCHLCELLSEIDAKTVSNIGESLGRHIRYQYILEELQDAINDTFSRTTYFGFTVIKIAICMFLFSTVAGHGSLLDLLSFVCVITLVLPIYLRCNACTNLLDANESVISAIYDQNWYEGSVRYRKAITIMMLRANKPKALRASQLRQISMEYFKEIMVDTYQVFMFFFNSSH